MNIEDMKIIVKSEIEKIVRKCGYNLDRTILFGSRAEGKQTEESDWDILVVIKEELTHSERKKLWYNVFKNLHKILPVTSLDVIIKSYNRYEIEKNIVNTLANEAKKGIVL